MVICRAWVLFLPQNPSASSSAKKANEPRSKVLFRLLGKARNEKPYDPPSFFSAGKQYHNFIIH